MMVAGTYVLTDTIDRSFERIFTQSNEGVDAVVTSKQNIETFDDAAPPFPASVLKQVEAVDGVAAAEGSIADQQVSIIGADGDPRGGNGAPSLGFSVSVPYSDRFDPLTYVEGGPPDERRPGRDRQGLGRGRGVRGRRHGHDRRPRRRPASTRSAGSPRSATSTRSAARRSPSSPCPRPSALTGKEGELDQISVAADEGVTPERLAASLKAALPDDLDVETGAENVESQRDDIGEFTGFIKTALLIFAGIALFVGAFLIFNTFSITVAQRTREFAMLRTLGASRRQILSSVVLEAAVIGLGAAVVGVAARDRLREGDQRPVRGARASTCPRPGP